MNVIFILFYFLAQIKDVANTRSSLTKKPFTCLEVTMEKECSTISLDSTSRKNLGAERLPREYHLLQGIIILPLFTALPCSSLADIPVIFIPIPIWQTKTIFTSIVLQLANGSNGSFTESKFFFFFVII